MPALRARARRTPGFTLLELCVVLAIIGLLAAMGLVAMTHVREQDAISVAPRQFITALQAGRAQALATGRDVVLVVVGNNGPSDAGQCRADSLDWTRCVRYWLLEDVVDASSARFDDAALAAFDPAAPAGLGDRVLESDHLPEGIYLGRHPGYRPPTVDTGSTIYADLPLGQACSFCTAGSPPRGYVRFRPDGVVQLGGAALATASGGTLFFNVARGGAPYPDTRLVAILQPAGLFTDRLGRAGN